MSRILITGASGFIGSNLTRKMLHSKNNVSIFVRKESNLWRLQDILSDLDMYTVDMNNLESTSTIVRKIKPEYVFHLAAYGVYPFQKDLTSFTNNISCTVNLMQSSESCGSVKRFVNVGTSAEYKPKSTPMKETDMTEPVTPYGITKLAQTLFAQYFANQHDLSTTSLRLFSPYGPHEQRGRLITDIMFSLIHKTKLELFSPSSVRDFIYIDDVIDSIQKAAKASNVNGEIFNIGSGRFHSVKEVVEIVCDITNTKLDVSWGSEEKKRSFDSGTIWQADIKKAKRLLGWEPMTSLRDGLCKTLTWFRENIDLYVND